MKKWKKWDGQISEEAHIAIHYAHCPSQIEALKDLIKDYGDRRALEIQEKFDRYVELDKLDHKIRYDENEQNELLKWKQNI